MVAEIEEEVEMLRVIALTVLVSACAPMPYGAVESAQADQQCKYEAVSRAGTYDRSYSTLIGQSMDLSNRQQEIYNLCVAAKGGVSSRCRRGDGKVISASVKYCNDIGGAML